ncbi:hypothetical protein ACS0TY_032080 [Phlomoides rotata]
MNQSKSVSTPFGQHLKLSMQQCPKSENDRSLMNKISYASSVGSLMYAMVCCTPDLTHAMSIVSRYMSDPGRPHWEAVKWIMRYLNGSVEKGLKFQKRAEGSVPLVGYVDADYATNIDTRKSLTGYVFTLFGTTVSWRSTH